MNHNELYAMDSIDYASLKDIIGKRKVCVWGAYSKGLASKAALKNHDIEIYAYLDAHKDINHYDELPLFKPTDIHNPSEYFLVIAISGVREEIADYLFRHNLVEGKDYIWPFKTYPTITVTQLSFNYVDRFGNEIVVPEEGFVGSVVLSGYNNKISIGKGLRCKENSYIRCNGAAVVSIGDYVSLGNKTEIICEDGAISIGNNTNIDEDSNVHSRNGGTIQIGKYTSIGKRFFCGSINGTKLLIGNDCMISHDVSVMSSSGFSIIDLALKKNVSLEKEKHCLIGNHVWIGKGTTILCNSNISKGCIVGANSLVKLHCDQNTIVAGNPARIICTNRTWDRRDGVDSITLDSFWEDSSI